MARFETHLGQNIDQKWVCTLTDEELAEEIVKTEWDPDLMRDLFWRADMIEEWEAMDGWNDDLCHEAAKKLGVSI